MEHFLADLRYTLRGLRRSPGFMIVAITTIALGIGVNTTIFSLVNAVLLRPLPVERPQELVNVYGHAATSTEHGSSSYPNFMDYRAESQTLGGMMAYTNFFASLSIEGSSELVVGEMVSEDYFDVLGIQPARGRAFATEEFRAPGAGPVAILSHPFWQSRFAGDPDVAGRTLRMNGIVYTVVGVAPRGFGGMIPGVTSQVWIPLSMVEEVEPLGNQRGSGMRAGGDGGGGASAGDTRLDRRGMHFLWIKGRMNPGVEVQQVQTELERVAAGLSAAYPGTNELERVRVLATNDVLVNPDFDGTLSSAGMVLLGAVILVLLVACANLANMMLARAAGRRQEFAVRISMGASRGRLVRQMLVESLTLALAGGVVAMLLAYWLVGVVARFQPPLPIDIGLDIAPDWRVLGFTLAVAAVTGVLFGLIPALRSSRPDLVPALKGVGERGGGSGGRGGRGGRGGGRGGRGKGGRRDGRSGRSGIRGLVMRGRELRDVLVIVQVGVSVVLLVCGALMVRSLAAAGQVDLGFDADRTAYLGLAMEMNGYDPAQSAAFIEAGRARLEALPEVEAVGLASRMPLSLNNNGFGIFIAGHQGSNEDAPYRLDGAGVDEKYFEALGLEILAGRGIAIEDREGARRVAVLTQSAAARYWPDEDAVGQEFRTSWTGEPYRIVGIVEDYKVNTPGEGPMPYLHIPLPRETLFANYVVKTGVPAAGMVTRLEQELRTLDAELVFLETGKMRALADVRLFPIRAGGWLMGAFGLLALVMAAVGLYGVISYSVSRRVREIGIRKALGASNESVVGMVIREGMVLVVIGGIVGGLLAALGASALSSVLFVGALDPVSFALALGTLAGVAALANWIPARRAAGVEPMVALKGE